MVIWGRVKPPLTPSRPKGRRVTPIDLCQQIHRRFLFALERGRRWEVRPQLLGISAVHMQPFAKDLYGDPSAKRTQN